MQNVKRERYKINLIVMLIVIIIFALMPENISQASTAITPADNQYLELRATTIVDVPGQQSQVIMELWGHEIDFKRI